MALIDSIVSYWKLDESSGNAADSAGSNTLTNANVTYTTGKINNGATFDSTSDTLSIADASQSGLDITGNFSISMWVNFTTLPASGEYQYLYSKWASTGNQRGIHIYYYNPAGTRQLTVDLSADGSTAETIASNQSFSTSTWYHVVFTFTAATSKYNFYVNASALGEQTGAKTAILNNTAAASIGNEPTDTKNIKGMIDEVGIWSKVLSGTEVTELYNSGSGFSYPFSTTSIKTINGLANASVKTVNGLAIASVKNYNGLA